MSDGQRTAEELFRDARSYADGIKRHLPSHLRAKLEQWDSSGGTAFAKLPLMAEILWAARGDIGKTGRELLRDIALWGELLGQQSMRNGRGEAIAFAIIFDLRAGEVVAQDSDPPIDVRLVKPEPQPEPVELPVFAESPEQSAPDDA